MLHDKIIVRSGNAIAHAVLGRGRAGGRAERVRLRSDYSGPGHQAVSGSPPRGRVGICGMHVATWLKIAKNENICLW